jgi:hypothetical protein
VTFFGCGNVTVGPAGDYPYDVTLLVYDQGSGEVTERSASLDAGERPGSSGSQLVGVSTPFGTFVNPNFDFDGRNCSGVTGNDAAQGQSGDPRDRLGSSSLAPVLQALGDGAWLVVNPTGQPLEVTWSVDGADESGQVSVPADDATAFETQPGATVALAVDGEEVTTATGPGADESSLSNLTVVALGDGVFGVVNTMDNETTVTWSVEGNDSSESAMVEANAMTTIETDGNATVSVEANGTTITATPPGADGGGDDSSVFAGFAGSVPAAASLAGLFAAAGLVVRARE